MQARIRCSWRFTTGVSGGLLYGKVAMNCMFLLYSLQILD